MLYGQQIHVWINLSQETQGTDLFDFFSSPFYDAGAVFKAFSATSERTLISFCILKALKYSVLK